MNGPRRERPGPDVGAALRQIAAAAWPYRLKVGVTRKTIFPDLIFLRADSGEEIARLRYFEPPDVEHPRLNSILPVEMSDADGQAMDRFLSEHVSPVLARLFVDHGYVLWARLFKEAPPEFR